MLTKSDFEKAAEKIASEFVASEGGTTLNQLAKKVAAENNLNPDQIRTMVRLANVSTFSKLFTTKTGSDRNVKFEVGDPENVIDSLYDDTKSLTVAGEKVAAYNRNLDYFGDLYPVVSIEKVAHESKKDVPVSKPRYSKPALAMQLKRASDRFRLDAFQEEHRWKMNLETAASIYKKAHGLKTAEDFSAFEKDMISADADVSPEVQAVKSMVLREKVAGYGDDVLSQIVDRHVSNPSKDDAMILQHLKTASLARASYMKIRRCQDEIAKNLESLK
jgi:hypothetical protein